VRCLTKEKENSESSIQKKFEDLMNWEQELTMREDRLLQQSKMMQIPQQLAGLLQRRQKRKNTSSKLKSEVFEELLEDQYEEVG